MSPTSAFINGYQQYTFSDFSDGLNLRDKADTISDSRAIDLLNVDFGERGAIRQRDGIDKFTPFELDTRVDSLSPFYNAAGARQLVAGCDHRLEVIDTGGAVIATKTGMSGGPYQFARFADPLHEYLYAANGSDALARWDGTAWTDGAAMAKVNGTGGRAMPKAGAVCVTAMHAGSTSGTNAANRLVATAYGTNTTGGPGGTPSTPSRVHFSNPGAPEVWEEDGNPGLPSDPDFPYSLTRGRNYIELTPGDGERIQTAVTWRELVFVFKETKFFVIWGEGVQLINDVAIPTFQVREVVNSIGLASPQAVAVGRDGVYFMNRRGVYRTNGGDPELLSDALTPMWTQDPDVYFQSDPINLSHLERARMLWHMERLYLAVPTGVASWNNRVLVFDTQHGWWTLYDWEASALASFRSTDLPAIHLGVSNGGKLISRVNLGQTNDYGGPITSRWRSSWSDYGNSQVKTLRETKLWGTGSLITSFSIDYGVHQRPTECHLFGTVADWPTDGTFTWDSWLAGLDVKWPGAGNASSALVRRAVRGTVFSTEFSNCPLWPTWSIHRVARHLRETREPSIR